ncbi:hypothetical protein [Polymorphobacter fuscus]|uniref:DUF2927 domain-containing protein n=1 Tax=Sandarakinorhabdus fusca TaxID=1439888 RepID=A0A7C9GWE4_9SPHN|nr:hypothetical protein [Polymorphobacter fuscus]KAB7645497.1 hypothetical protein F9290_11740 [Polymorphobacter fuscus]MQT17929.1 hypothetical protein [Polymorphobacter fuscus]NJC08559.1 hypothetical protein [Polymorphobacter fuscus]
MTWVALALALTAAAPASDTITVTADRLAPEAIEPAARAYVRNVLPTPVHGQYGRWADPVCIRVAGVDDALAARVTRRISAVATEAAVKLAKPGCKPNLEIVFTEDAATTTRVITARQPRQIARLDADQRATLRGATLPVRWWHGYELRDRDGQRASANGSAALMSALSDGGVPLSSALPVGPDAVMTDSRSSSLIDTNTAVWVTSGVVVIDVTLATGKPLDAVADYAALAALAPMQLPPPAPGVPSILALFSNPARATETLSGWDRAWLAALYRIPMNRKGEGQRGEMAKRLADAMTE